MDNLRKNDPMSFFLRDVHCFRFLFVFFHKTVKGFYQKLLFQVYFTLRQQMNNHTNWKSNIFTNIFTEIRIIIGWWLSKMILPKVSAVDFSLSFWIVELPVRFFFSAKKSWIVRDFSLTVKKVEFSLIFLWDCQDGL